MKKKRFLPMCLCLVLALGLSACNDLEDLADSGGDDETSEVGPTEPGDTGDTEPTEPGGGEGPSESVPTYSIQIVDPSEDLQLEVGESATIAVSLVTTVDNTDSRVAGTASEVTLYSSNPSVVSVEGLTIYALSEGEAVITATWTEHNVTSSDLHVTVTAPVYTPTVEYSIAITSPSSGLSFLTNNPITIGVNLITTVDGTPTSEEGSAETVKLNISPETSSATIDGLTITDTVAETVTVSATWIDQNITSDSITITFVEPSVDPVITYDIDLTYPSADTVLYVGGELTVVATLYTYSDEAVSASEPATADNVTVTSDASSTGSVTIEGLTITGETAGSVILIVTWGEYATSSVTFTVESVYTYAIDISNPTVETTLEVGGTLDVSATLITYTDGTPTGSEAATASNVVVTQTSGDGSVDVSGLTITGKSAGEVTLTVTWGEYATEEVTFEVISVITYGVKITSPTSGEEVEIGSTLTFTIDLITYTDGVETGRDTSVSSGVTLSASSSGGEVDIDGLTITGKTAGEVTITATDTHGESDSITIIVTEPQAVFESYTITIQLKTSDGQAFPAPTGTYSVFINSEYDVDAWSSWGTHLMTYDETSDTYSYTYTSLPTSTSETHTANFYASETADTSGIPDDWSEAYLGYYMIPVTQDSVGVLSSGVQEITTSFTSWDDIFNPPASDVTFIYTITFKYQGTTLAAAESGINLYAAGDYNLKSDGTTWEDPILLTNNNDGTYDLTLDFVPANDTSFEILVDDTNDSAQDKWDSILGYYSISDLNQEATGTISIAIEIEATHSSIDDLLHPDTSNYIDFYILVLDSSSYGFSSFTAVDSRDHTNTSNSVNLFNGSGTSSVTVTATGASQACMYNAVAGSAAPGETYTFYFHDSTWGSHGNVNDLTIPENSSGYAVYVCLLDTSYISSENNNAWAGEDNTCGWHTGVTDIASFVSSLTTTHTS